MSHRIVFLHGLETPTDDHGRPTGTKATWLRNRFDAATPALDTTTAQQIAREAAGTPSRWTWPFDGYEQAFATPMERARAAITDATRLVIGSSFGGAVLLRLMHETPGWSTPVIFLASAGGKLTSYTTIPAGADALLVHGRHDEVIPFTDSQGMSWTSPRARLLLVEDDHRLGSIVNDEMLGAWIEGMIVGTWPEGT